ncbi:hypothetical protein PoB_002552800 [Plakobranchus ocellatus]|uniref:Uncharacterized protein n=1 Tax=Plakobranchus ocellatus TaxID=259542 RepID=A0AAV3ZX85_9GAST|nr:hypothetical protein PoB_002552800 [Plakobranchus ocellatus]
MMMMLQLNQPKLADSKSLPCVYRRDSSKVKACGGCVECGSLTADPAAVPVVVAVGGGGGSRREPVQRFTGKRERERENSASSLYSIASSGLDFLAFTSVVSIAVTSAVPYYNTSRAFRRVRVKIWT